ncbi:hypothetical protein [Bacillus coreaensis]
MKKLLFMFTILIVALLTACSSSESSNAADKENSEATEYWLIFFAPLFKAINKLKN